MSVRHTAILLALAAMGLASGQAGAASTFVGGEIGWVDSPVQSTLSRQQVRSEAIRSHLDGTMLHAEYAPKAAPFQSTRDRAQVRAEAIKSHMDGTMVHSEVEPKTAK
jgi:hypothetical protein